MRIKKWIAKLEAIPFDPARILWLLIFVGLGRSAEEILLGHARLKLEVMAHFTAFYVPLLFGLTALSRFLTQKPWRSTIQAMSLGLLLGLMPPLLDTLINGPGNFTYTYLLQFSPTFHYEGYPLGETITVWTAIVLFGVYIFLSTGSIVRTLLGFVVAYALLMTMGYFFPQLIKRVLYDYEHVIKIRSFTAQSLAFLGVTFLLYLAASWRRFAPSLKRVGHALPFCIIVLLGASLVGEVNAWTVVQATLVLMFHQGIVIANDFYDQESDQINQRACYLEASDVFIIHALLTWLALTVSLVLPTLGLMYLLYVLAAFAYHHPILRFKDIFPLGYLLEGFVASLALIIGMLSVGVVQFGHYEIALLILTFFGFGIASIFKDYKDIAGDRAVGTRTLYVILSARGLSIESIHWGITFFVTAMMLIPLIWLAFFGTAPWILILLGAVFVVPIFISLRHPDGKNAVRNALWIMNLYLIALWALLGPMGLGPHISAAKDSTVLSDYGRFQKGASHYQVAQPASIDDCVALIRKALQAKTPIRIRGNGHSKHGQSLPRSNELLVLTDKLRDFRFDDAGTLDVGAGVKLFELRNFLKRYGYSLPVYNDGLGGPTVGGFISAGGIGRLSKTYGGFWENVLELSVVTGTGEILHLSRDDPKFKWFFGAMGQLGLIVSAKLKIINNEGAAYPINQSGQVPAQPDPTWKNKQALYWFTVFVPKGAVEDGLIALKKIQRQHASVLNYIDPYVYPMRFITFNPELVYPQQQDFVGIGVWGNMKKPSDRKGLLALEKSINEFVFSQEDKGYKRYIQTEVMAPGESYEKHWSPEVLEEFRALKRELDPESLLNCGVISPCPTD